MIFLKFASLIWASLTGLYFTSTLFMDYFNKYERNQDEHTHLVMMLITSILMWIWIFI